MVFRPEKQATTPYRCKKCQKLGHTERFCTDSQKCQNCGSNHNDMTNCTEPPYCANCKGDLPASSLSCPQFIRWKMMNKTEKRNEPTHQDTKGRTYRDVAKTNLEEHHPDPEVEILRSKIDAMQTEMKMI